jgi:hypothetical protein
VALDVPAIGVRNYAMLSIRHHSAFTQYQCRVGLSRGVEPLLSDRAVNVKGKPARGAILPDRHRT